MGIPLAVIGGGNMANAILSRASQAGCLDAGVTVAEPDERKRAAFPHAVANATDALEWLAETESTPGQGRIMLAIKPQVLPEVSRELAPMIGTTLWPCDRCILSILAGASTKTIAHAFNSNARVVRIMPNTPALVGRGMAAMCADKNATAQDRAFAKQLFQAVGTIIEINESQMDAFTAVGGSGPAYVFLLAQAMVHAARNAGLSEADAVLTTRETIAGAGLLLGESSDHPEILKNRVTSKGGTTAAALEVFERGNFQNLVEQAILAACDRGAALAALAESSDSTRP